MREGAPEGSMGGDDPKRIVLHLANVPAEAAKLMCSSQRPICVWSMLEHERQVSVLHFQVKRFAEHDPPVKMKEEMQFQLGFRRFQARPIYSNCTPQKDKSLCERYLHHSRFSVASVYARVHVGVNAPVLMFLPSPTGTPRFVTSVPPVGADDRMDSDASHVASLAASSSSPADALGASEYPYATTEVEGETLVANGIYLGANTDRILVKRIILTGFPVGVNKRAAVVRRMFYNPDDVRWFMPVELWTKYGLVGHVKEPRGTKGLMKCVFDGFIKNHDTVCMSLYKRQFPPWAPHYFE
jgi:pre-rRNA-processing protein TSR1